jgi:Flp pilus assembly protein TadD
MSQAQALWTGGSRDAAIELMREAVMVAERSATPAGSSMMVPLVRELARMELAEGQATRVLEMLTRLEPTMAGQADLWAVRGNAAQRLGRHQESANAYLRALRLRPEEPRWMLGAAVSLAAQGQTAAAADLAEKARAGGAVSREVAAYLRQLGVPLRE